MQRYSKNNPETKILLRITQLKPAAALELLWDLIKFLLLLTLLGWLVYRGTVASGYNWQWHRAIPWLVSFTDAGIVYGPLLQGLQLTFKISLLGLLGALLSGLVTVFLRLSDSLLGRLLARLYLETIRNTPLLVQLIFFYFVLGPVLGLSGFTSAVLALSLFEGAYASEIMRAGIQSVHQGQWEAASSLGMNRAQAYRYIILPQALRRSLPPLASQGVSLIKDSALVSTIAIYDISMHAQAIVAETYLVFEIWFMVALIYLIINFTLSFCINRFLV